MPTPGDALIDGLAARGYARRARCAPGRMSSRACAIARARSIAPARLHAGRRRARAGARTQRQRRSRRSHRVARPMRRRRSGSAVARLARGVARRVQPRPHARARGHRGHYAIVPARRAATRVIATVSATTTRACSRACCISTTRGARSDGGALRLYLPEDARSTSCRWAARSSRSCRPTSITRCCRRARERLALTGWFRRRVASVRRSAPRARILSVPAPRRLTIATRTSRPPCGRPSKCARA